MNALIVIAGGGLSGAIAPLTAQSPRASEFAELRPDGNGVAALQTTIVTGFNSTSGAALAAIAVTARLNLTYDPLLKGLNRHIRVPASRRSAARALLQISEASQLRIRVSRSGQVVVDSASPKANSETVPVYLGADTLMRTVATLAAREVKSSGNELGNFALAVGNSSHVVSAAELNAIPTFIEPDVLRAVQLLPGVESRSDWTAAFSVRGGEGDQSQVLLDGFPIFNPFHVGGIFSTFIDGAVSGVELHTGSFPARFGGRLSGILDVKSAAPVDTRLSGTLNVSMLSASATAKKAFSKAKGGWMLGVRRTYADVVMGQLLRKDLPYYFEDLNGRFTRVFGGTTTIGVTAYGGRERLEDASNSGEFGGWNNLVLGTSLSRAFNGVRLIGIATDSIVFEPRLSVSRFRASARYSGYDASVLNLAQDERLAATLSAYRKNSATTIGYEIARQSFSFESGSGLQDFAGIIPFESLSQNARPWAAFATHNRKVGSSIRIETGARLESNGTERGVQFSPRASFKYFVTPAFSVRLGAGRYTQWMHSLGRDEEPLQPFQFWALSDTARGSSTATDAVAGVEHWLTPRRFINVSGFTKSYGRILSPNRFSDPSTAHDAFNELRGTSRGVEVLVRQLEGQVFSGWVSYTLAKSLRTDATGETFAPAQDRRHNLNAIGSWSLNRFTLGARLNVASGYAYTPQIGGFTRSFYNPYTQKWTTDPSLFRLLGKQGSERTPVYKRFDVSLSRSGQLFGWQSNVYVSVVNAFNFQNDAAYYYEFGNASSGARKVGLPNMPLVPSIGVKFGN